MTQLPLLTDEDHEAILQIVALAASCAVACEEQGDSACSESELPEELYRSSSLVADWWEEIDANEDWIAKQESRGEWESDEREPEEFK